MYKAITVPFLWIWVSEGVLTTLLEPDPELVPKDKYRELTVQMVRDTQSVTNLHAIFAGIGTYYDNPYLLNDSFEEARESMIDRFFQRLIFFTKNGQKPRRNG